MSSQSISVILDVVRLSLLKAHRFGKLVLFLSSGAEAMNLDYVCQECRHNQFPKRSGFSTIELTENFSMQTCTKFQSRRRLGHLQRVDDVRNTKTIYIKPTCTKCDPREDPVLCEKMMWKKT